MTKHGIIYQKILQFNTPKLGADFFMVFRSEEELQAFRKKHHPDMADWDPVGQETQSLVVTEMEDELDISVYHNLRVLRLKGAFLQKIQDEAAEEAKAEVEAKKMSNTKALSTQGLFPVPAAPEKIDFMKKQIADKIKQQADKIEQQKLLDAINQIKDIKPESASDPNISKNSLLFKTIQEKDKVLDCLKNFGLKHIMHYSKQDKEDSPVLIETIQGAFYRGDGQYMVRQANESHNTFVLTLSPDAMALYQAAVEYANEQAKPGLSG